MDVQTFRRWQNEYHPCENGLHVFQPEGEEFGGLTLRNFPRATPHQIAGLSSARRNPLVSLGAAGKHRAFQHRRSCQGRRSIRLRAAHPLLALPTNGRVATGVYRADDRNVGQGRRCSREAASQGDRASRQAGRGHMDRHAFGHHQEGWAVDEEELCSACLQGRCSLPCPVMVTTR